MHVLNPLSYLIHSYFMNNLTFFMDMDCISNTDCIILGQGDVNMSIVLLETADPDFTKMSKSVIH